MNPIKKTFQYGAHQVTLETGEIARQASGAVFINMADTVVMVTVVGSRTADPGRGFFPLTVDYQEKTYAAGRIPGGFFKREGRPSEKETLTCRLIDRPIRPLFPKGFMNEVQVVANVLSSNPEVDADVLAMLGTSAALAVSGIPFNGPIGACRVGYINGDYVLNPTASQLADSALNLVVAGTSNAVLMVESEANCLSEEVMLGSVVYGHEQMQTAITAIEEFAAEAGAQPWDWQAPQADETLADQVKSEGEAPITEAYGIADKMERQNRLAEVRDAIVAALVDDAEDGTAEGAVRDAIGKLEKKVVRGRIIAGEKRIDGRDTRTVPLDAMREGAPA